MQKPLPPSHGVIGVAATLEPGAFTCYPLSSVRLRDEDDEAKVPKVDDLMQLNWHFGTEREESPRLSKIIM